MKSLSFDGLTALYDQTRTFDPLCLGKALDWLEDRFPPTQSRAVLEPGIGTGRIALPLVKRGYRVTGLDISKEMLSVCVAQSHQSGYNDRLHCMRADTTRLPFPKSAFDLCVAVHLFYFIPEWRGALREMLRVLKPDGALVLLHTGFGTEVPSLNVRYQELAQELGYIFPTYGVRSTKEVLEYAVLLGCSVDKVEAPSWNWTTCIRLQDALSYLEARAYSFTKHVPKDIHAAVMNTLQQENCEKPLSMELEVLNHISIVIVRRTDN